MDFLSVSPSIDVIIGPMFSGKTTELHRRLNICVEAGYKVVYVNSKKDTRAEFISTHNSSLVSVDAIKYIKTECLLSIQEACSTADVIGIDESQFFPDLIEFAKEMCETFKKKVIVSGLNCDFNRNSFGQVIHLITISDTVTKLNPFCSTCRKENNLMTPALFSKRICDETDVLLVGGKTQYIPVCRSCYIRRDSRSSSSTPSSSS